MDPEPETTVEGEAPATPETAPETEPEAPVEEQPVPEVQPEPPAEEPAPETPEEPVVANEGGEVRFSEQDGKHFWKRYDATGALVFTSPFFDTEEEARADADAAA